LAADIKNALNIQPELIRSGGGVFEVRKDSDLIFSKKALGRFPTTEEILSKCQS
jgi:predicted Rdx family selenoprotein